MKITYLDFCEKLEKVIADKPEWLKIDVGTEYEKAATNELLKVKDIVVEFTRGSRKYVVYGNFVNGRYKVSDLSRLDLSKQSYTAIYWGDLEATDGQELMLQTLKDLQALQI